MKRHLFYFVSPRGFLNDGVLVRAGEHERKRIVKALETWQGFDETGERNFWKVNFSEKMRGSLKYYSDLEYNPEFLGVWNTADGFVYVQDFSVFEIFNDC